MQRPALHSLFLEWLIQVQMFTEAALALRRGRGISLSFFVQFLQKFLEFGFLFGSEDRPDLIAAFLPGLTHLSVELVVIGFIFGMQLRQDGVQLLALIHSQT